MLRHWVEWTRSDVLPFYFYSVGCSTALWNIMFLGVTSIHAVTTKFHIESEEIAPDNQQFFLLRSRLTLYNTFKASRTQCISGGCRCRGLNTFQLFFEHAYMQDTMSVARGAMTLLCVTGGSWFSAWWRDLCQGRMKSNPGAPASPRDSIVRRVFVAADKDDEHYITTSLFSRMYYRCDVQLAT